MMTIPRLSTICIETLAVARREALQAVLDSKDNLAQADEWGSRSLNQDSPSSWSNTRENNRQCDTGVGTIPSIQRQV